MQLDVIVLFFIVGFIARAFGSKMTFPSGLHQGVSIFLMLAIGLKGGLALADYLSIDILIKSISIMLLGFLLPLIAFPLLRYFGEFSKDNSAAIAAHYGSVSIGTYAVAIALLESQSINYEGYFPVFVVLLEFPAMIMAMLLVKSKASQNKAAFWREELLGNQSLVLLFGGLIIGFFAGEQAIKIMPLFKDLFYGVLAIFLLDMGLMAASQLKALRSNSLFLIAFGIVVPLINGLLGAILAKILGFSMGGIFLSIVLTASASYIAVPMAMRTMIPKANHALGLMASLGVTFPFNIIFGLPAYWLLAEWFFNL